MSAGGQPHTLSLRDRPRQRHPRYPFEMRVVRYDSEPNEWRSVNVSESGLFVRGTPVLVPGTVLDVGLWLPAQEEAIEIVSRARVVWHNDPGDPSSKPDLPAGMGLELLGLDAGDRRVLKEQLYRHNERPALPNAANEDSILAPGVIIGSYRILEVLGSGGMGHVYLAEHVQLGRRVAVKRLHDQYANDASAIRRFFAEGRVVNRVRHPNILEITDFISDGVDKCYVMELLEGQTVTALVNQCGMLPLTRVLRITIQVCAALQAVHEAGIIHRDLKPGNIILIERDGDPDFVKLVDFGISKVQNDADPRAVEHTAPGVLVGSPGYMAPEQAIGSDIDHRCDIYAFGVLLYQMLTGQVVFTADTWSEVLVKHVNERPLAPRQLRREIPVELETLVMKCLAKKSRHRPQTAGLVGRQLRRILRNLDGGVTPPHLSAERRETGAPVDMSLSSPGQITRLDRRPVVVNLALPLAAVLIVAGLVLFFGLRQSAPTGSRSFPPAKVIANPDFVTGQVVPALHTDPALSKKAIDPLAAPDVGVVEERDVAIPQPPSEKSKKVRKSRKRRRVSKTNREPRAPKPNALSSLARAAKLIKAGYTNQAIRIAKLVIKHEPRNGRAFRVLGIAYAILGDWKSSCDAYRRYLIYTPKAPDRDQIKQILRACR